MLVDKGDTKKKVPAEIEIINGSIYIKAKGYGDACSKDGYGNPIIVEVWDGELRVVVWSDINQEDPTHNISMEGAKENKRNKL